MIEHSFDTLSYAEAMFQGSLFAASPPHVDRSFDSCVRHDLGQGAWVDEVPNWLGGADEVFDRVYNDAPWESRERQMWNRQVAEPRLATHGWHQPPDPIPEMSAALCRHYDLDVSAVSANLYRNGADSVAWHGDRAGSYRATTVVAIVSLGAPRRLLLRPTGGGPSLRFTPSHGDLIVMGGTCQHTFEHAVPKAAKAGARISVMFREPGVI